MGLVEAFEQIGVGKPTQDLKQMVEASDSGIARFKDSKGKVKNIEAITVKDIEAMKTILKHREDSLRKFKER